MINTQTIKAQVLAFHEVTALLNGFAYVKTSGDSKARGWCNCKKDKYPLASFDYTFHQQL